MLIEYYLVIVFLLPGPAIKSYVKAQPFTTQPACAEYAQTELHADIEQLSPEAGTTISVDCVPVEQETI